MTSKEDVELAIYLKRAMAPAAGEALLPVLLLVHGSSISALPTYDLTAGQYRRAGLSFGRVF